ncbi:MAG: hypothetical protein Q8K61_11775 [Gallionella sp.]|nr:hypothetical protein [Gallionella sp.]
MKLPLTQEDGTLDDCKPLSRARHIAARRTEMRERFENMTPEERKQFRKDMKEIMPSLMAPPHDNPRGEESDQLAPQIVRV